MTFCAFTEDLHTWFVYASPASSPYAKYRGNTILKLEDLLAQNSMSQHTYIRLDHVQVNCS